MYGRARVCLLELLHIHSNTLLEGFLVLARPAIRDSALPVFACYVTLLGIYAPQFTRMYK